MIFLYIFWQNFSLNMDKFIKQFATVSLGAILLHARLYSKLGDLTLVSMNPFSWKELSHGAV